MTMQLGVGIVTKNDASRVVHTCHKFMISSCSPLLSPCLPPLLSHLHSSPFSLSPFLPQVHIFSYQCSQLSTPESVIEVFNTAKRFQKNQDTTKYVSVVVLDEVGLAEDSPNLPLKALHPLLEDGTEGADDKQEVGSEREREKGRQGE